ncbi:DUF6461 domain-containing protein [Embleya hyalina]|uniref:Uncharacterized protein n=1 Tax=Embleya hyalina TaxID=516124 RepID=A0A401YGK2_9ACTN|nr:DUF6461 domain-containing protein [Embleya hyalina]GCD93756.1 hypothetical protein EHYA_01404 [Embleya hyalina]
MFCDSLPPTDVLRVFDSGTGQPLLMSYEQSLDAALYSDTNILRAGVCGGWTFCQESFGCTGLAGDYLSRLSESGQALLFFWNLEAMTWFAYACRGRVEASFEPRMQGAMVSSADTPFMRRIRALSADRDTGGLNDLYLAAREILSLDPKKSDVEGDLPALRIAR